MTDGLNTVGAKKTNVFGIQMVDSVVCCPDFS